MLYAIIMAGGAGTRFWPASRFLRPKQLLNLAGERTMIQGTADRLRGLVPDDRLLVVTNRALVESIRQQLPQLPPTAVLGEPCKRDTAPCVGLAAILVSRQDDDATMLVTPADQIIATDAQFQATVLQAVQLVEECPRQLVTFGIRPSYPAETFGYIERGESLATRDHTPTCLAFRVHMFREKPSVEIARQYLASGKFYWNSGIFVWKAKTILEALRQFEPDLYQHLTQIAAAIDTADFEETLLREFSAMQGKSIDYAVMERYDDVAVIEAPFAWDDVGSWQSLARLQPADQAGNTVDAKHLGLRTRGCIIRGEKDHLIVTVGLEDCIIVHTPDATLIARKQDEEAIRQVVAQVKQQGWEEFL